MNEHRGEIVEATVRKSGYSIKAIAEKMGVSRNTIYNKFREHDLSYDFIIRVGNLIHYDFTLDFPEIKTNVSLDKDQQVVELWKLERRYIILLERYNRLLGFLVKVANDYQVEKLKKDIERFMDLTS